MVIPTPIDRGDVMASSYAFTPIKASSNGDYDVHNISVAIATSDITGLLLDGVQMVGFVKVGSSGFSAASVAVPKSSLVLMHTCSRPFVALLRGYLRSGAEAYGTAMPIWDQDYVNPAYCDVTTTQRAIPTTTPTIRATTPSSSAVSSTVSKAPTTTLTASTTGKVLPG